MGEELSFENPLELPPISSNLAVRAWFRDRHQDAATNSWQVPSSSDDWFDLRNWSLLEIPVADQGVIIPEGAMITLTNATPELTYFELQQGAMLNVVGWESTIEAEKILIAGTITHTPQSVTGPDSESGEWERQHRIWLKGSELEITATGLLNADNAGYPAGAGPGVPPESAKYSFDYGGGDR